MESVYLPLLWVYRRIFNIKQILAMNFKLLVEEFMNIRFMHSHYLLCCGKREDDFQIFDAFSIYGYIGTTLGHEPQIQEPLFYNVGRRLREYHKHVFG